MKKLINEIARLASQKYQNDFILNGTKDSYVLPEEMIDTMCGTISTILGNEILRRSLSIHQMDAIKKLDAEASEAASKLPWALITKAGEVLERPEWIQIRQSAKECLQAFSVTVEDWEASRS